MSSPELESLKAKADLLGISYSPNIGVETLRARINEKMANNEEVLEAAEETNGESLSVPESDEELPVTETAKPVSKALSKAQRRLAQRKEATKLVRCRITCMNPAKIDVPGEIIAVCNSAIGVIKHFVPFGEVTDNGWHIPNIIYEHLLTRQCTIMRPKRTGSGSMATQTHEPVQIKEFSIELMEPLTAAELKALAQRQAMAAGTQSE